MRKKRIKPPKFYVSTAMKLMNGNDECLSLECIHEIVLEALRKLSEAVSCGNLAPLPIGLEGSLYDPKMLRLRSDEEFSEIYMENFKDTAEEHVVCIMYHILLSDTVHHTKCRIQKGGASDLFDYSEGAVRDNIHRYAMELHRNCSQRKYQFNVPKMLSMLYPYIIQFADRMNVDLNSLLEWYMRYRRVS